MRTGSIHARILAMKHWLPLGLTAVVACSAPGEQPLPASESRVLRIDGSTTLYKAVVGVAAQFEAQHGSVDVRVASSSSSKGIALLIDGAIDVAMSARPPTADELAHARERHIVLKPYQVGYDAIAVIVHPDRHASVPALSFGQLRDIFLDGSLRDWSQLAQAATTPSGTVAAADPRAASLRASRLATTAAAPAERIDVYVCSPAEFGTALSFIGRIAGNRQAAFLDGARVLDGFDAVIAAVATNPRGIGFAPLGFVDERVRAVALGVDDRRFIAPSAATILDLSYPLRRSLYLVTRGTPREHLNLFLRLMLGERGREILALAGVLRML
jgi:phosphate transport system substrate-binding protein